MSRNEFIKKAIEDYTQTVLKIAFSYTKNTSDAEDIAQDVFYALLREEKVFSSENHLKAWLVRVTINKSKNYVKSTWFSKRNEMPEELVDMPKENSDILYAVFSLKEKYRIPIHLFYYEGYSIREIAEILKIPTATVGTRLKRGREQLKKLLGSEDCLENE